MGSDVGSDGDQDKPQHGQINACAGGGERGCSVLLTSTSQTAPTNGRKSEPSILLYAEFVRLAGQVMLGVRDQQPSLLGAQRRGLGQDLTGG